MLAAPRDVSMLKDAEFDKLLVRVADNSEEKLSVVLAAAAPED